MSNMAVKDLVVSMFRSGMSQSDIRKKLGVHSTYVSNTLRDSGDRATSWRLSDAGKANIQQDIQGSTRNELIEQFGVTEYQVRMALRGITRTPGDSNHLKAMRDAPQITEHQRQLLLGSLLGDASISKGEHRGYRVQISHSEKQVGYSKYLGKVLKVNPHPYVNSGFSELSSWKLTYQNIKALHEIAQLVLVNGKKMVNQSWLDQMSIQAIAHWFMDDGSSQRQKYGVNVCFHTQGFSRQENELLAAWMTNRGFLTRINKCKSGSRCFLSMSRTAVLPFMTAIKPHVWPIKCMRYKIKFPKIKSAIN